MIEVRVGELSEAATSAILRPVSAGWTAVTGATRRLELAAGEEVAEQCRRFGELPVGSAMITGGGRLGVQFMVHVIVRSSEEQVTEATVRRALQNGLRRAVEWGIESMTMPPLGTGAGNLDAEDAAYVMIDVITDHMQGASFPARVELVVENEYERLAFENELRRSAAEPGGTPPVSTG